MKFFYSAIFLLIFNLNALAHFQVILPNTDVVIDRSQSTLSIQYIFTHPFEQGPVMEMAKPIEAAVYIRGEKKNIKLNSYKIDGKTAWKALYKVQRPGDHIFTVIPKLYFEPAEQVYIQHITKVIVNAYGMEDSWDKALGLKAEIVPLTRSYGLWVGQSFTGQVLYKGKPVANAEIEMEYYNKDLKIKAPNDSFITQVLKADNNGVFHVTLPIAGWWTFAALIEDDYTVKKDGKEYPVELGAVFWMRVTDINK